MMPALRWTMPAWYNGCAKDSVARRANTSVADHPNKHIRDALDYAEEHGWTIRKSGPRAHA
jgi:hypothetical protein